MTEPRERAERLEQYGDLPSGNAERFAGYGIMGVPFASGDLLAMRRFVVSSLGEAYTSVWHRDTGGRWTIYTDVPPNQACPRYFGSALSGAVMREIGITWTGPRAFTVSIDNAPTLVWRVSLSPTPATRAMNAVAGVLPDALWRKKAVLKPMERAAGVWLRARRLGLTGRVPNGQRFIANPMRIWAIASSTASMADRDLGDVGPLPVQTKLGDFWIPQRGIFATGRAYFEPLPGPGAPRFDYSCFVLKAQWFTR